MIEGTGGPWRADGEYIYGPDSDVPIGHMHALADGDSVANADAKKAAAAPEMLEALEASVCGTGSKPLRDINVVEQDDGRSHRQGAMAARTPTVLIDALAEMAKERVLVCGGRDFQDYAMLEGYLDRIDPQLIIHGDAPGADRLANKYALSRDLPMEVYPADWENLGRSAGPRRNIQMLKEGKPTLVVAFPGGKGTEHMANIAARSGVPVLYAHQGLTL